MAYNPLLRSVPGFDLVISSCSCHSPRLTRADYRLITDPRIEIAVSFLGRLLPSRLWVASINDEAAHVVAESDPVLADKAFEAAAKLADALATWPDEWTQRVDLAAV